MEAPCAHTGRKSNGKTVFFPVTVVDIKIFIIKYLSSLVGSFLLLTHRL